MFHGHFDATVYYKHKTLNIFYISVKSDILHPKQCV